MIYLKIKVLTILLLILHGSINAQPIPGNFINIKIKIKIFDNQGKRIKMIHYKYIESEKIDTNLINTLAPNKSIYIYQTNRNIPPSDLMRSSNYRCQSNSILFNYLLVSYRGTRYADNMDIFNVPIVRYQKNKIDTMLIVLNFKGSYRDFPNFVCNLRYKPGVSYIDAHSTFVSSKINSLLRIGSVNISPKKLDDYFINDDLLSYNKKMVTSNTIFRFNNKYKIRNCMKDYNFWFILLDKDGKEIQFNAHETDLGMISYDTIHRIDFGKYPENCINELTLNSKDSMYIVKFLPFNHNKCLLTGMLTDSSKNKTGLFVSNWSPVNTYLINIKHLTNNGYEEMNILGDFIYDYPWYITYTPGNYYLCKNYDFARISRDFHTDVTNKSYYEYKKAFIKEFKL